MVQKTIAASAKASAKIEAFPAIKVRTFADHVPGPAPVTVVRKSADALTATEQQTFMNAITSAIADGAYSTLVRIHAIMSHDMHTMPGRPAGTQRFLPWHRLYLINFEQDMRRFEPIFFVPYWHWMDQSHIPDWMTGFKPKGVTDANGKPIVVTRRPGTNPQAPTLPTSHTIRTTVMNHTVYTPFTLALEGAQPFGASCTIGSGATQLCGTFQSRPRTPCSGCTTRKSTGSGGSGNSHIPHRIRTSAVRTPSSILGQNT